jgi:hypothetical protein
VQIEAAKLSKTSVDRAPDMMKIGVGSQSSPVPPLISEFSAMEGNKSSIVRLVLLGDEAIANGTSLPRGKHIDWLVRCYGGCAANRTSPAAMRR